LIRIFERGGRNGRHALWIEIDFGKDLVPASERRRETRGGEKNEGFNKNFFEGDVLCVRRFV